MIIKDIKFTQAISCQGYLKKQRPGVFNIFQKRFYTIRDKGNFLVWFKNRPTKPNEVPQGVVTISDIEKIVPSNDDKVIFQIHYPDRTFLLKAQSEDDREKWVSSLNYILEFNRKYYKELDLKRSSSTTTPDKKNPWRWSNTDQNIAHKVQLQNEQILIDDNEDQQQLISDEKNKQIMRNKRLVLHLDNQQSMNRIVGGYLYKKGKISSLTQFKLRWFFMVSDINLKDPNDKKRLILNEFPDWVKINTLYYFSPSQDNEEFRGNIQLQNIKETYLQLNQSPFKLILKTEDRQYTFGSKFISEIKKWDDSIRAIIDRWNSQKLAKQIKMKAFKSQKVLLFEGQITYNDKLSYLVVKQNSLAILNEKDDSDFNESTLIEFSSICTSVMNKKQLKINGVIISVKIEFDSQKECQNVQKILLQAQSRSIELKKQTLQIQQVVVQQGVVEYDPQRQLQNNRNTYLGRKYLQNQNKSTKNFYTLYAMGLEQQDNINDQPEGQLIKNKSKPPPEKKGFFQRLLMMFCGESSDD